MKTGNLAFELHARVQDDQVVVSREELDIVAAQLQRLSPLIASFGKDTFDARFEIGLYCTITEDRIEFDVVTADGSGDCPFNLHQFITWCMGTDGAGSVSASDDTGSEEDTEGHGIEALSRVDTNRILTTVRRSRSGFINDIVETVWSAVKVTTPNRSYVMVDVSIDAYAPGKTMPRPCGKPLGQLPLLPRVDFGRISAEVQRRQGLAPLHSESNTDTVVSMDKWLR